MNAGKRRQAQAIRDQEEDRIAATVSEQLNQALGHLDLRSIGCPGGVRPKRKPHGETGAPEPRFGARRQGKRARPPGNQSQRLFDFDSEVHR